ncbi:MAG: Holliday junction resolvase RuvX [Pseudomonadota bacterium]|nr:Holliday junction resolvase RuvX [Pseudomonadota bacterium]
MILPDFKGFPRSGRIIGIDWGAARTGVAVSDASREFLFVRPQIVVKNPSDIPAKIVDIATAEQAVGIIIGLPLRGDGTESDTTARVRDCAAAVEKLTEIPIAFIDESYSSTTAQDDMGRVRRGDIKTKLDSESARVILENAIAMMRRAQ